jgi:hypothetical protein
MAILRCCSSLLHFCIIYTITSHALKLHEIKLDSFFKDFHANKIVFLRHEYIENPPPDTNNWEVCFNFSSFTESCSLTQLHFFLFQIIITVSQIIWAQSIHRIFASDSQNIEKLMKGFEDAFFEVSQPPF